MLVRLAATPLGGDSQTRATLSTMRQVVHAALSDPHVVEATVNVVRGVSGRSAIHLAARIEDWARHHVVFLPDPLIPNGGEFLRTPDLALQEIRWYGVARLDCDDAAMLTAAMCMAVGVPCQFRAVAYGNTREPFAHVYTQAFTQRGWYPLDVTNTGTAPEETRAMTLEV